MAKCKTCGKGLLESDRKRGRCGKCGLNIHLPAPRGISAAYLHKLKTGKGPPTPPAVSAVLDDCNWCKHGEHEACQEALMWFCNCWRRKHKPAKKVKATKPEAVKGYELLAIEEDEFEDFL